MASSSEVQIFAIPHVMQQQGNYDIAVTRWGTFLLAGRYLIEINAFHEEVSRWKPHDHGFQDVLTVEELDDGRVAVGLSSCREIVILERNRRQPGCWLIDRKIRGLSGEPRQISACGNLLAVKLRRCHSTDVAIISVSDEVELFREDMGYRTKCVCVTPNRFIIASEEMIDIGGDSSGLCQLECCNHSGHSLWLRYWEESINDIASSPSGTMFFLAVAEGNRVAIISADSGLWIRDVVSQTQENLLESFRISVSKQGRPEMIALLFDGL